MSYTYGKTFKASAEVDVEEAIEWMKDNLEPDDVFEEETLREWAQGYDPDEIFEEKELQEWATKNGYVLGNA